MLRLVSSIPVHPTKARSQCPDCQGTLAVLRVIPGRAKPEASAEFRSEYWTLRCTKCGGIHLDILKAPPLASDRHADSGADGSPVPGG
jgi:Zn finger protein HypA/HybF involved in hydrogenase expression